MQNGDILQIKDVQSMVGIEGEVLNVFYFSVGNLTTAPSLNDIAESFAIDFAEVLITAITPLQSNQLSHVRLDVNNLMEYETDFFSWTYETVYLGGQASGFSSSASAYSIQLTRTNRTTRHGSKRIAGVAEALVENNVITPTGLALMATTTGVLGGPIFVDFGGVDTVELTPVILKSPVLTTAAPTVINPVQSATYRGIGSQNTRKQLLA
jgi:hypothetical protein